MSKCLYCPRAAPQGVCTRCWALGLRACSWREKEAPQFLSRLRERYPRIATTLDTALDGRKKT